MHTNFSPDHINFNSMNLNISYENANLITCTPILILLIFIFKIMQKFTKLFHNIQQLCLKYI